MVLGTERKALLVFETFRFIFIPLTFPDEELCLLVEEFGQKTPIDISGILSCNHPLCKILALQRSSDLDDWE